MKPDGSEPVTDAERGDLEPAGVRGPGGDAGPEPAPEKETAAASPVEGHDLLRPWVDREEVRALPEILRPGEGLVAVGSGTVVRSGRLAHSKWLVVLTDRRLLCLKGRHPETRKLIEMPISAITDVESKGLFQKTLSLETGYGKLRIDGLRKDVADRLVSGVTTLMAAYDEEPEPVASIPVADMDKAGTGGGHTHEELRALQAGLERLEDTVKELTDRVAFVEELVRSNVSPESGEAGP